MKEPIKICIIQMTRIGDIIQTYRAAMQLKSENKNVELTLITRTRFSKHLGFLLETAFEEIIEFETEDFFDHSKVTLKEVQLRLSCFLSDIKKHGFQLVINLSFTKSSSFLTSIIAKDLKMGLYRNERAQIGINDKWSQFIYSNVMESSLCPLNLVDIYKGILGAKETDITHFKTPKNKVITVHPFASSHKKSWGSAKWSEVLYQLLQNDQEIEINIVGATSDTDLADRIMNNSVLKIFNKRIHNHVGINTIEDTFNLLSNSQLFIGHDSMVSHLAGLLRMPSVVLSLGTVRPHETTPYNDRVINLSPKNGCFPCNPEQSCELLPCHNSLNFQVVTSIVENILKQKEFDSSTLLEGLSPLHIGNTNIFKTSFDDAGLRLTEVSGNDNSTYDIFRTYYRMIWSYFFQNIEVSGGTPQISQVSAKELSHHLEGIKHLFELYNHGFQFCDRILIESEKDSPSVSKIQDTVGKLAEIDDLVMMTKKAYPYLSPIADFFFVHKANASGSNIIEITNNHLIAFHEAKNITAILNDLLQKTVGPRVSSNEIQEV